MTVLEGAAALLAWLPVLGVFILIRRATDRLSRPRPPADYTADEHITAAELDAITDAWLADEREHQ